MAGLQFVKRTLSFAYNTVAFISWEFNRMICVFLRVFWVFSIFLICVAFVFIFTTVLVLLSFVSFQSSCKAAIFSVIYLMNVEQRQVTADPQTKSYDLGRGSICRLLSSGVRRFVA